MISLVVLFDLIDSEIEQDTRIDRFLENYEVVVGLKDVIVISLCSAMYRFDMLFS